jgi:hypothetical protein
MWYIVRNREKYTVQTFVSDVDEFQFSADQNSCRCCHVLAVRGGRVMWLPRGNKQSRTVAVL